MSAWRYSLFFMRSVTFHTHPSIHPLSKLLFLLRVKGCHWVKGRVPTGQVASLLWFKNMDLCLYAVYINVLGHQLSYDKLVSIPLLESLKASPALCRPWLAKLFVPKYFGVFAYVVGNLSIQNKSPTIDPLLYPNLVVDVVICVLEHSQPHYISCASLLQ